MDVIIKQHNDSFERNINVKYHVGQSCSSCNYNSARQDNLKNHLFDIIVIMSQSPTIVLMVRNAKIEDNVVSWRLSH